MNAKTKRLVIYLSAQEIKQMIRAAKMAGLKGPNQFASMILRRELLKRAPVP